MSTTDTLADDCDALGEERKRWDDMAEALMCPRAYTYPVEHIDTVFELFEHLLARRCFS